MGFSISFENHKDKDGNILAEATKVGRGAPWKVKRASDGKTRLVSGSRAKVKTFMRKWATPQEGRDDER